MDRNRIGRISDDDDRSRAEDADQAGAWITLASRRTGFAKVRAGILDESRGVVLITGEGGAGKTWLWTRAVNSLPSDWRAASVDLTSGLSPAEFLLLVGHGLGLELSASLGTSRLRLAATLRDEAADGRSWVLVVDDADSAAPDVWEEVRVLSNRIGRADGFAALVIVAQTGLIRRLAGREFASIAGRIGDHVHLPPLDLDECRALIQETTSTNHARTQLSAVEEIQRDARGNCGEVLRLARRRADQAGRRSSGPRRLDHVDVAPRKSVPEAVAPSTGPVAGPSEKRPAPEVRPDPVERGFSVGTGAARTTARPPDALVPSRPPLRLEEGLIEVGWRGDSTTGLDRDDVEDEPVRVSPIQDRRESDPEVSMRNQSTDSAEVSIDEPLAGDLIVDGPAEEWLEDPYAAIQAWSEWARNRELAAEFQNGAVAAGEDVERGGVGSESTPPAVDSAAESVSEGNVGATIRAEARHEFSPYGRLFSELHKSAES